MWLSGVKHEFVLKQRYMIYGKSHLVLHGLLYNIAWVFKIVNMDFMNWIMFKALLISMFENDVCILYGV